MWFLRYASGQIDKHTSTQTYMYKHTNHHTKLIKSTDKIDVSDWTSRQAPR